MKEFIDRVSSGKKIIRYENGTTETVTIENAEDATVDGTPINRKNLMAIQGFDTRTIVADETGHIFTCTNSLGETLIVTFDDYINAGSQKIAEVFTGEKVITKTTDVKNGVISEVIS